MSFLRQALIRHLNGNTALSGNPPSFQNGKSELPICLALLQARAKRTERTPVIPFVTTMYLPFG